MSQKLKIHVRTPQDGLVANVPGKLIDSQTFDEVDLPAGAVISTITVFSESGTQLESGRGITVGYNGNFSAIVNGDIGTDDVNTYKLVIKKLGGIGYGLTAEKSLYAQTSQDLTGDPIGFEITYYYIPQ